MTSAAPTISETHDLPAPSPDLAAIIQSNSLYVIPVLIVLSLAGCLLGTFLTSPEDAAKAAEAEYKRIFDRWK
jgi:hypothetical protein